MSKPKLVSDFDAQKTLVAVYTGGPVEWRNGLLFTGLNGDINVTKEGSLLHKLEAEEDPALVFTTFFHEDVLTLIVAHKSSLIRQYVMQQEDDWKPEVVKTFRSIHTCPISIMKIHLLEGSKLLATGGADGTVKIWDLEHKYYTHNFRAGSGVCSVIEYHPTKFLVFGGFMMGQLFCWDMKTSRELYKFDGHFNGVTGLKILTDKDELISVGRDKVIIIWDLKNGEKLRTIPASGAVEGLHASKKEMEVVLAVEDKLIHWDLSVPKQLKILNLGSVITKLQTDGDVIHCATVDHNLVSVSGDKLKALNTVVGNNDEVLCLTFCGKDNSHLLVGCNSHALRLYKVEDYSCQLISGHTDTVMCMSACASDKTLIATGGKDRTVKIWKLDDNGSFKCLVTGTGHSDPVQGVTFLNTTNNRVITVSKDTTVKSWNIDYEKEQMSSFRTEIGHEKEINCCCVSPGDEMLATGSQDKLCKLWDKDLNLISALRGHKRGVWCAQFSPQDQLLATGSADAVIKIWNLGDYACVKQLEGQECSVLSLAWISGHQIVSSGSDGLIKVWWVTKQEALTTLDSHTDRVWSLATRVENGELEIASGSTSGELIFWKDVTETAKAKKQEAVDNLMLGQQKLANLIAGKLYTEALKTALRLSQPFTVLKLLKKLSYEEINDAVLDLTMVEVDQLLGYSVKWNSNSKHSEASQAVLHVILTNYVPDELMKLSGCRGWVEGLLPYTEKHFDRLSRLQMKCTFLVFMQANMKATGMQVEIKPEVVAEE